MVDSEHRKVSLYLEEHSGMPVHASQIAKDIKIKLSTVRTVLHRLFKSNRVIKVAPGYYQSTKNEESDSDFDLNTIGIHALQFYIAIDVTKQEGYPPPSITEKAKFITENYKDDISKHYTSITKNFKVEGNKCVWSYPIAEIGTIELQISSKSAEIRATHIENNKGFTPPQLLGCFYMLDSHWEGLNLGQNFNKWTPVQIDFCRDSKHTKFATNELMHEAYKGLMIKLYNKGDDARTEGRVVDKTTITSEEILNLLRGKNTLGVQALSYRFDKFTKEHIREHKLLRRKMDELIHAVHEFRFRKEGRGDG